MKRQIFKTIRTKLTFWLLIIALLPLFASLFITYYKRVEVINKRTFNKLEAISELKVKMLNNWLDERIKDFTTASRDHELQLLNNLLNKKQSNQQNTKNLKAIRRFLNRHLEDHEAYEEIFIINPQDGIIIASARKNLEGTNRSTDMYYKAPLQLRKFFIKDIYYSKTLSKNTMALSIPVFSSQKNEQIIGIMVAYVNLKNSLYDVLSDKTGLGKTGETLIVNKNVIALNDLRWYENAPLNLTLNSNAAQKAAKGERGIMITKDYRGETVLAVYSHIPKIGWGFVCKQDLHELDQPVRDMVKDFIILFIVSSILIFFIVMFISKTISFPIVKIDSFAKKISRGNYDFKTKINSNDEIGSLSNSIKEMAESIKKRVQIQMGVASISKSLISNTTLKEFSSELIKIMIEVTKANMGVFYILNEERNKFEHLNSIGANKRILKSIDANNPEGELSIIVANKKINHIKNVPADTIIKFKTTAGNIIPKEILTIPILINDEIEAVFSIMNINQFSEEALEIINIIFNSINVTFANILANKKTKVLAENLSSANSELEKQKEKLSSKSVILQNQNKELEIQKKQVEEANRLKSEFLSNISHELRTPLNSILALSRVLILQSKEKLSDEENEYLKIVERNGKHLLSLINEVLDLSKIESGKIKIHIETVNLNTILSNINESLQFFAKEKGIGLILEVDKNLPSIKTDEGRLYQVLMNIINNAIKFTHKGEVKIYTEVLPELIKINIQDTGIGIEEKELNHIFEEFRQVDGTTTRKYEGTGLGLSISNKLITILDGQIDVKSVLQKGSTFTITLPINNNSEHNKNIEVLPESKVQTIQKDIKRKQRQKPRILIIEDLPDNMITIKAILKDKYEIIEAEDGERGLFKIVNELPDLILLDIALPKMNGMQIAWNTKKYSDTGQIPIIAVTAKVMKEEKDKILASGCDDFIAKPIKPKILLEKINLWLKTQQ